jgi:hypothetical protein
VFRRQRDERSEQATFRERVAQGQQEQLEGPVDPPACPSGRRMGPLDFVGVGVQKAGTTWWHSLLTAQPQVHASVRKELHLFQHGWYRAQTKADVEQYHRYFPKPATGCTGEWTPRYMLDPWTPVRLRTAAPVAKLLVLLRGPIEPFRSHVTHAAARHGNLHLRLLVEAAERGRYGNQRARLERHLPRNQLLVLQLERCAEDVTTHLAATYRFLELDDAFVPPHAAEPVYTSRGPKVELAPELVDELRALYRPELVALAARYQEIDVDTWQLSSGALAAG